MILMAFKFLFDQVIQTKHINIIPASIPYNYPYIYIDIEENQMINGDAIEELDVCSCVCCINIYNHIASAKVSNDIYLYKKEFDFHIVKN